MDLEKGVRYAVIFRGIRAFGSLLDNFQLIVVIGNEISEDKSADYTCLIFFNLGSPQAPSPLTLPTNK